MLKGQLYNYEQRRWAGLRVGLFGGSFNPPHQGHLEVSRIALRMLQLDCIWWLVTPGNPLKNQSDYEPLSARLHACEALTKKDPDILVTTLESRIGTYRTYDTLKTLTSRYSSTNFVFLMGSDSARNFHEWYRWTDIPALCPLAIIQRPPALSLVSCSRLKMKSQLKHIALNHSHSAELSPQTCFWMHNHPLHRESSSDVRKMIKKQ